MDHKGGQEKKFKVMLLCLTHHVLNYFIMFSLEIVLFVQDCVVQETKLTNQQIPNNFLGYFEIPSLAVKYSTKHRDMLDQPRTFYSSAMRKTLNFSYVHIGTRAHSISKNFIHDALNRKVCPHFQPSIFPCCVNKPRRALSTLRAKYYITPKRQEICVTTFISL